MDRCVPLVNCPAIFLSPGTLCYLTMWLNFCYSLPMTAALVRFYSLPCYLATRQSLIFKPSNGISHPLLTICRMCLAICHHFYFHLLFATHSMRCRTSRCSFLPPSWFSNRLFTTKASQAARHALRTSRPSSITHLGTCKYPTQPSPLEMLVS